MTPQWTRDHMEVIFMFFMITNTELNSKPMRHHFVIFDNFINTMIWVTNWKLEIFALGLYQCSVLVSKTISKLAISRCLCSLMYAHTILSRQAMS